MTRLVRLAINGASGRMGRALQSLIGEDGRLALAHAVVAPGSPHDGQLVFPGTDDTNGSGAPSGRARVHSAPRHGWALSVA